MHHDSCRYIPINACREDNIPKKLMPTCICHVHVYRDVHVLVKSFSTLKYTACNISNKLQNRSCFYCMHVDSMHITRRQLRRSLRLGDIIRTKSEELAELQNKDA
jgi:hypothetical protein